MRRIALALIVLAALVLPASAVSYIASEQIAVAAASIGFTNAAIVTGGGHPGATVAVCRLATAAINMTFDGTAATASNGTLLYPGDTLTLQGNDVLLSFRAYRATATSGVLSCTYTTP